MFFDPHVLLRHPESMISEREFNHYITRAVSKYGCVQHGQDCPLKEGSNTHEHKFVFVQLGLFDWMGTCERGEKIYNEDLKENNG